MTIYPRSTWGAVAPKSTTPFNVVYGWIVHWVGGSGMNAAPTLAQSCALMLSLQKAAMIGLHGDVYVDFEYNFAIDPMGRIFEGRGWTTQSGANGTTAANTEALAVVYLAGPGVPLTAAAEQALLALTQAGTKLWPQIEYVEPHDEVPGDSTGCPGPDCTAYCPTLQAALHAAPAPPTVKVKPMYDPPLAKGLGIAASWELPAQIAGKTYNVVLAQVAPNGDVYAYGVPYRAWPNQAADMNGRAAAAIGQLPGGEGGRYQITCTDGTKLAP